MLRPESANGWHLAKLGEEIVQPVIDACRAPGGGGVAGQKPERSERIREMCSGEETSDERVDRGEVTSRNRRRPGRCESERMSARAILGSGADVKTAHVEGQVVLAKTNASVAAGEEEE